MLIVGGAVLISFVEQLPFDHALYFSFVTGLTIGYGDIVATTSVGRIISIVLGVIGIMFTGLVVAVGDNTEDVTITVKAGDTVLFPKYTGTEVKFSNEDYIIMDFEKVLAVLA